MLQIHKKKIQRMHINHYLYGAY